MDKLGEVDVNEGVLGTEDVFRRKSGIDWGLQVEPPSVIPLGRKRDT